MLNRSNIKAIFKIIGILGVPFLLGVAYKGAVLIETTKNTNQELPELKTIFSDFKMEVNTQLVEIKTTIKDFLSQHKEEDQMRMQETLDFQNKQIKALKEKNREANSTDSTN